MFLDPDFLPDADFLRAPMVPPVGEPNGGTTVQICINKDWLPYIAGACMILTKPKLWATASDADTEDIIERANSLIGALNMPCNQRPFYQNDEETNDETAPAQPWYDNLADWIIELFLATTFTMGAAVVYSTTIPQARVAIRTGNLGALWKILLNGVEMLSGSSYSATQGHIFQDLDLLSFASTNGLGSGPWTLSVVHDGVPGESAPAAGTVTTSKLEVELGDIRPGVAPMVFRTSGCVLQGSFDGVTWVDIFDPTSCINGLVSQGITDAINNGTITGGRPQQNPDGTVAATTCNTYHVQLLPGSAWHCPVPVMNGYSIHITNPSGGWSIGEAYWFCPDGAQYVLGGCNEGQHRHTTGDPLGSAWHMQLIGLLGNSPYFDPLTSLYTVTNTSSLTDFVIMANTNLLGPPSGSVEFDITICNNQWVKTVQGAELGTLFRKSPSGGSNGQGYGQWNAATNEWWSADNVYNTNTYNAIGIDCPGKSFTMTHLEVYFTDSYWDSGGFTHEGTTMGGSDIYNVSGAPAASPLVVDGQWSVTDLFIQMSPKALGSMSAGTIKIQKIVIYGTGTDPF